MDYFHLKYYHDHLDPEVKRQKRKKEENFRVSQWLDRYITKYNDYVEKYFQNEFVNVCRLRCSREDDIYVETQIELLSSILKKMKEEKDKEAFSFLKHEIIRTLSFEHDMLKRQIINIHYEKEN